MLERLKGSCSEFREIIVFTVIANIFGYLNESIDEDKGSASWEIPALALCQLSSETVRIRGDRHDYKGNECYICIFSTEK